MEDKLQKAYIKKIKVLEKQIVLLYDALEVTYEFIKPVFPEKTLKYLKSIINTRKVSID